MLDFEKIKIANRAEINFFLKIFLTAFLVFISADNVISQPVGYYATYCNGIKDSFTCPPKNTVIDTNITNMLTLRYASSDCPFPFLKFDEIPGRPGCISNNVGIFVHTMSFPLGTPFAIFVIKLKAGTNTQTSADYISFYDGTTFLSGSMIKDLPGAGGTWNHNQQGTFTLNLASLPGIPSGFQISNILPYIQDGKLDIVIGTGTGVDYICMYLPARMIVNIAMQANRFYPDSIKVFERSSLPPFGILDSSIVYAPVYGSKFYVRTGVPNVAPGTSCYIAIKHRNTIETWSATPVTITGDSTVYDFTTSLNKAYGNNMTMVGGLASLYGADINQDMIVDASDLSFVDNDGYNFVTGYVSSDVTCDGFVDVSDAAIVDNNGYNFVYSITP